MTRQLTIATLMVLLTVVIHGVGLFTLIRIMKLETEEEIRRKVHVYSIQGVSATLAIVIGLFFIHGVEIWCYGLLYLAADAMPDLETAIYFSTMTYSTIGYSDMGIPESWRIVAAIEGINGIILMGWTTAFFVPLVARLGRR